MAPWLAPSCSLPNRHHGMAGLSHRRGTNQVVGHVGSVRMFSYLMDFRINLYCPAFCQSAILDLSLYQIKTHHGDRHTAFRTRNWKRNRLTEIVAICRIPGCIFINSSQLICLYFWASHLSS